jgi:deazaflavin-dependent oxidoreductase (nitroreductase family)
MTRNQQAGSREGRRRGSPGPLSRWVQQRMNARMNAKIRRGRGSFLGMDVLILHTVGRQSRQPRQSPVAWFADGQDAWQIVASGGRQHPDWYLNLMAHPERAWIELPGRDAVPVTPQRLDGADRAQAWQRITTAQPRYAK